MTRPGHIQTPGTHAPTQNLTNFFVVAQIRQLTHITTAFSARHPLSINASPIPRDSCTVNAEHQHSPNCGTAAQCKTHACPAWCLPFQTATSYLSVQSPQNLVPGSCFNCLSPQQALCLDFWKEAAAWHEVLSRLEGQIQGCCTEQ